MGDYLDVPLELILLPGLDGTGRMLAPLIEELAKRGVSARALAYPTDQALDYVELERRVRAELHESGAFVLLAESFSGPIALRIGSAPPDNMKGIVLSTTFAARPTSLLGPLSGCVQWARVRPPMFMLDWFLLGRWSNETLRSELAAALSGVPVSVLSGRAFEALHVDAVEASLSQKRPAMVLWASQDRLLSVNARRQLANALQTAQTRVVEGPHLLLQTQPRQCSGLIAAFMQKLTVE